MLDFIDTKTTVKAPLAVTKEEQQFRDWFASALNSKTRTTLLIQPWQAEIMLETNTGNRTLSMIRAQRYALDMKNGAWDLTGEPVIFSDIGVLNDGQTRLKACVLAEVPFITHVTFGIARRAFAVTGIGAKRSLSDVFSIENKPYPVQLAAALNWVNRRLNGWGQPSLRAVKGMQLLTEHPDIQNSCEIGCKLYRETRLMPPSLAIFLHYTFSLKDQDQADAFFDYLITSIAPDITGTHDARLVLRQRLMMNSKSKARIDEMEIAALSTKAWNCYRRHEDVRSLRWMTNPAKGAPETFPVAE